MQNVTLFEGEVVVAEGFFDNIKFNVNRIIKPSIPEHITTKTPPNPEVIKNYANKSL